MSDTIKQLRRIIYLLSLLKDDFEWLSMSATPDRKKKIMNVWRSKIEWVLRDITTSTQNKESFDLVFAELNSDRAKSILEWIDLGIQCKNIDDLIALLHGHMVPVPEEKEKIPVSEMPDDVAVKAYDMVFNSKYSQRNTERDFKIKNMRANYLTLPYDVVDYLRSENIDIENKHEKR